MVSMTTGSFTLISPRDAICICTHCAHTSLLLGAPTSICTPDQVRRVSVDDEVHTCQLQQPLGQFVWVKLMNSVSYWGLQY